MSEARSEVKTPRKSSRLHTKVASSTERKNKIRKRIRHAKGISSDETESTRTSSSDNDDNQTSVLVRRKTNDYVKVYNTYNKDSCLDVYEKDFIDDRISVYKKHKEKEKEKSFNTSFKTSKRLRMQLVSSDEENLLTEIKRKKTSVRANTLPKKKKVETENMLKEFKEARLKTKKGCSALPIVDILQAKSSYFSSSSSSSSPQ